MTELEIEKLKLDSILVSYDEIIEDLKLRNKSLPLKYKDNPDLLYSFSKLYTLKLELMKKCRNKPYFARIDFKSKDDLKIEKCYLGKVGVSDDDNNIITVDWRAPIASIYYDSNIGKCSYTAPEGKKEGSLLLKRQYEIEKAKLLNYRDVDTVSNDEILKPYLEASADNRLKNIVASIQGEQNSIIRENLNENIIVQGVAGSGKTTVALHRIAYLVYNNRDFTSPDEYLVIGPNKFFVNYISGVLPDLDVNNVLELTYDEIVNSLLNEKYQIIKLNEFEIKEKIKTSLRYMSAINKYFEYYNELVVPKKDLIINNYKILSYDIIKRIYNSINENEMDYKIIKNKVDKSCILISKYISDNKSIIIHKIKNIYFNKIENLDIYLVKKEKKLYEQTLKEINNGCKQSLKKYFNIDTKKVLPIYLDFLEHIEEYLICNKEDLNYSINNIKKKKVEYEDLSALLYIKYRLSGSNNFIKYKHVVIDEAQDYGEFNFYVLKELMPKSTFSIFGDLAQSIYDYRSIERWEDVVNNVFEGDCKQKYLLKSYRTTTEIMNIANKILEYIKLDVAQPVIRHGKDTEIIKTQNQYEDIINKIKEFINNNYNTIAVISKNEEESKKINKMLIDNNIESINITDEDTIYNGGICTISSSLAKGLEFDAVIISDASNNIYDDENITDMKLLYVATTRALHELVIMYKNNLVKPFC